MPKLTLHEFERRLRDIRKRKPTPEELKFEAEQRMRVIKPLIDFPRETIEKLLKDPKLRERWWKKGILREWV